MTNTTTGEWELVVSDQRVGARVEIGKTSRRPYLINREGTWVHRDDLAHILSLERPACCTKGTGTVKPAYHVGRATAAQMAEIPIGV